jgi:hypothetical protein
MPEHVRREGAGREVLVSEAFASAPQVLRGSRGVTENRPTLPGGMTASVTTSTLRG